MPRWMLAALLLAPLATGCADQGRTDLDRRLSGLIGISEADLLRRLDLPPTRTSEAGGATYLAFYQYWPDFVILSFRPANAPPYGAPDLIDRYCEITYAIRDGKVAGYTAQGSACGWGGYPMIKPA